MVSVLAVIIILLYGVIALVYLSKRKQKLCQWKLFCISISICIFLGFGSSIGGMSYITLAMLLYDLVAAINFMTAEYKLKVNEKSLLCAIVFFAVILVSALNVSLNPNMPEVILMDTSMDSVYYGKEAVHKAVLSRSNLAALRDLLLMAFGMLLSREYFISKDKCQAILHHTRKMFYVYFLIASFEFLVNNLFSPEILRSLVVQVIGSYDLEKVWTAENRFGYYGVTVFFSEQSYISVMIIFLLIVYVQGLRSKKEIFWFLLGILVLFMSGCTTGLMLLPLAGYIYLRDMLKSDYSKNLKSFKYMIFVFGIIGLGALIFNNIEGILPIFLETLKKISAFLNGGTFATSSERSGAIRNFGNHIALNAFYQSPLFGVGIGTTRGYGILSGLLANFGALGVIAYILYLNSIFKFNLRKKGILFVVTVLYFSIILSVWYVYYFAFIPVYIVFGSYGYDIEQAYDNRSRRRQGMCHAGKN